MTKLSVIIPVYGVESTLNRCVESVLSQYTKNDMEVILVDDGSPDRCPQMCDEWAKREERILVVHKKNGGLSDARNSGLNIATGDYITFVDSDDWIAEKTYESLMMILQEHPEYDMIEYPYEKGERTMALTCKVYRDANDYWLKGELYRHAFICNKIFKRHLFSTIRFPKGRVFEDIYIMPQLTRIAKTIFVCNTGLYHYTCNDNGITMTANGNKIQQLLEGLIRAMQDIVSQDSQERQAFYLQTLNTQLEVYSKGGDILLTPYDGELAIQHEYTWQCKIKIMLYHALGIRRLCILYKYLDKLVLHRS